MMKNKLLRSLVAFSLLLGLGLAGCGGNQQNNGGEGGEQSQSQSGSGQQERITITAAENKKSIMYGETLQLTASVSGVTWSSNKTDIATVDQNGLVTSVSKGSATISAEKEGYTKGSISITVNYPDITVTADKTSLLVGETATLTANQEGVTWASSNAEVASVVNGVVTANKLGSATIKASKDRFNDGSVTINVVRPAPTATLHWEDADHYAADGEWTSSNDPYESPVYSRTDGNASNQQCIAHFGNGDKETLAFTSSAAVKAELVITIASRSAISDLGAVMNVKFNGEAISLTGQEFTGGSSSTFEELSLGEVTLATDNSLVLEFLSGSAPYIDDLNIYAASAATITLVPAPTRERITVETASVTIEAGKTSQIVVTYPTDPTGITYTSSDTSAATVDENGLITGVSLGSANIIVRKEGMNPARVAVTVTEHQEAGEIRLEAEQAEEVVAGTSSFMNLTDGTSGITRPHSGGGYISGYNVSGEETLTFSFTAKEDEAGVYELSVNGSPAYGVTTDFMFKESTTITLNENEVAINADAKIQAGDGSMSAPRVDATLGEVTVRSGENTLVVVFHGSAPSLDFFRLVPKA